MNTYDVQPLDPINLSSVVLGGIVAEVIREDKRTRFVVHVVKQWSADRASTMAIPCITGACPWLRAGSPILIKGELQSTSERGLEVYGYSIQDLSPSAERGRRTS